MELVTNLLSQLLPLLLSSIFYGVLITLGIFVILLIRKLNLQDEIQSLVTAAEMIFPNESKGEDKKAWVVQEMQKVYPELNSEILNKLIERFVYEIKQ